MSTFREDGALALDWMPSYLDGVRERPVLARVETRRHPLGSPEARLPTRRSRSPPCCATWTQSSLRGSRTGRARASSGTSRRPGRRPGILAELLVAGLNQVGVLWRTSPALQELEEVTSTGSAAARPPGRLRGGHIEDTASTGVLGPRGRPNAAPRATGGRLLGARAYGRGQGGAAARGSTRKVPVDDAYRLRPRLLQLDDVRGSRHDRDDGRRRCRPRAGDRRQVRGRGRLDARGRGLRGGSAAVCPELRPHFAGWERADSIGVSRASGSRHPHGLLGPLDVAARGLPEGVQLVPVPAVPGRRSPA